MILDNYILRKISGHLEPLIKGKRIHSAVTFEKGRLSIILEDENLLEFSMSNGLEYLRYNEKFRPPSKNLTSLLSATENQIVTGLICLPDDRVIELLLDNDLKLSFVFVSTKKNVLLVKDDKIIDSYKDTGMLVNTAFRDYLPKSNLGEVTTVKDYLNNNFFHFNKYIRQEIISDLNIDSVLNLTDNIKVELDSKFCKLLENSSENYFLYQTGKEIFISPIRMSNQKFELIFSNENFDKVYDEALHTQYRLYKEFGVRDVLILKKQKDFDNTNKKLRSLEIHRKTCENSDSLLNSGNLILANMKSISPGDKELTCSDFEGSQVKIKLKPDIKPSENAQFYFNKYKGQKESLKILDNRIELLKRKMEILDKELSEIQSASDIKSINKMEKIFNQEKASEETSKLFRKFTLSDKYEVWVGKDSRSNDLLTTKYSSPHDLWFHVRGASGSHTVLRLHNKVETVEKEFIKIAASIAAYYSKSRNASNVMVAYCERKYVKKKKGMKSGSVIMEREKVVSVKPGLPEITS